ncbi:MAG: carbohydrate binding family 9 domain-containing protein [Gemmatimonadota bacterium]|nr:MAG: carbohydrate binding family 9 domain-containing protein [Gemmatimonadota bacterium]
MCLERAAAHAICATKRHALLRIGICGPLIAITINQPGAAQTPDSLPARHEAEAFQPNHLPTLQVARATGPIEIDGELDDAGWIDAVRAMDFAEHFPNEGEKPPVESEVWITYDEEALYLAFVAYDDPGAIRASLRDRDEMWNDDYFGILLDTYADASWAYFLFANPLGVQGDSRWSANAGEDASFDIIYYTEAKISNEGYQVEMAIPFKSLRFPNRDVQTWRVNFWRTWPRDSRAQHTWAGIDRDDPCFLCQFGTLTGIEGVKPGGALELMPAVVASQAGQLRSDEDPGSGIENEDPDGELSLFVRYPFSSGLTTEAAFNPDFSQVESDVAQIDVNRTFALFFPERRPFFQEGGDLFRSPFNVLYTRQFNDPIATGKLIGRMGRTTLAYLAAVDEHSPILLPFQERSFVGQGGRSISNVARFQQTFLRDSYVGAIVTDRRFDGGNGSGTTAGIDGRFRILDNYSIEYQALASYTDEPDDPNLTEDVNSLTFDGGKHTAAFDGESYWGHAVFLGFERNARTWFFDIDYWASSPTFRADLGFQFQNDFHRATMLQGLILYPDSRFVDQVIPVFVAQRIWNFDGLRKEDALVGNLEIAWKGDTRTVFEYVRWRERFAGIDFDNGYNLFVYLRSGFSEMFRPGFYVSHGRRIARFQDPPTMGKGTDAEVWLEFKPLTRWVIEPSLNYSQLDDLVTGDHYFSGYIFRTRTTLQFTREFFLRLVVQYNNFSEELSIEPLLTYRLNPFTLFYIGSTQGYQDFDDPHGLTATRRQYFAKFQYLFRG